jgi:D-tyrosyl-tRNA(Tyr) deacylase
MIAVVQRVTRATVVVNGATASGTGGCPRAVGEIGAGLLALVAVQADDSADDVCWIANKLATLRIFRNGDKHFDLDVTQVGGSILLVSNFTVAGRTKHGRRPSFDAAAKPDAGKKLFDDLVTAVKSLAIPVATGEFGADMKVSLLNDGPATFIVNSRE